MDKLANILITGGTGFIGSEFVPKLLKKGHNVRLLVRNLDKAKKLFDNKCEYFVGDVTDYESIKNMCRGIDIVFHMVAKVGNHLPSTENFDSFRKVNVEGTANVIKACKNFNVKKFIYISSIAAMGIVKENPISEKSICAPFLPYQVSKHEAELLINKEFIENDFPGIIVRPTKVYGVGEHELSYLTLAKICKKGLFFKVGKNENYSSNIYITDLVQYLVNLVDYGKLGETYILTSNNSIKFQEVGNIISTVIGKKIFTIKIPAQLMIILASIEEKFMIKIGKRPIVTKRNILATITNRQYDISKAKNDLHYVPEMTMEEGIKKVLEWYKKEKII